MHYLIQKTTRQHIAVADDMPCPVECVKVRADNDGWVKCTGHGLPVPSDSVVDIVATNGGIMFGCVALGVNWARVSRYRPAFEILPAAAAPADTATIHDTAAMLLCIICAFALGALIGWGWM